MYIPMIGEKVKFGRDNGEKTSGTVMKVNRKTCKIRQDENRGSFKNHPIGSIWNVSFEMIDPTPSLENEESSGLSKPMIETKPIILSVPPILSKFLSVSDRKILEAIFAVYMELSPENLSCDGELSQGAVRMKYTQLQKKLNALFTAFGRPVSEDEVTKWQMEQEKM